MKTIQTNVTEADLVTAQGGTGGGNHLLWVECPDSYNAAAITAEDILHDSQIRTVREPEFEVEITLDGPCGPQIVYSTGSDPEDIEAAVPDGWEVDWQTVPSDLYGRRRSSPLRRVKHGIQFRRTDGERIDVLTLVRITDGHFAGETFVCEDLDGAEYPYLVQVTMFCFPHDLKGLYDLDGCPVDAPSGTCWEIVDDAPAEVIEQIECGWSHGLAVIERIEAQS